MPLGARRRRRTVAAVGGAVVVAHGIHRRGTAVTTVVTTAVTIEATAGRTAATADSTSAARRGRRRECVSGRSVSRMRHDQRTRAFVTYDWQRPLACELCGEACPTNGALHQASAGVAWLRFTRWAGAYQ